MRLSLMIILAIAGLNACSSEQVKRGSYGAMQMYQENQCNKAMEECPERESYEDYQRKRDELNQ